MDREDALRGLTDADSEHRLDAARALSRLALPVDEPSLRVALAKETTGWVRRALESALENLGSVPFSPASSSSSDIIATDDKAYLEAVRDTSDKLVHELRSVLGLISYWASKEFTGFGDSRTARQVSRLDSLLSAIDELGRASIMARNEEFSLGSVAREESFDTLEEAGTITELDFIGQEDLIARGDVSLVRLCIRNGLKNAVDASASSDEPIMVMWGSTDRDYWVAILDRARSLPTQVAQLFQFGASTKDGHLGVGLALVRQASRALGGTCELVEDQDGVTRFEVRWPRTGRTA